MKRALVVWAVVALLASACGEETPATSAVAPAPATPATPTTATTAPAPTTAPPPTTTTLPPTTTTTTELREPSPPGRGGEAIVADDQVPPTLNPYGPGGDNFIVLKLAQALHTGVHDFDGTTLARIPDVVVELPSVANGGVVVNDDGTMTVRYQIRDEAVWADGTQISGDDFRFTWEAILANPESPVPGDADREVYEAILADTVAAGAKTFEFTLTGPTTAHEGMFRILLPEHDVAGTDLLLDWNDEPWVSGGPFTFDSWERPGGPIRLVRNENYWKTDPDTGIGLPYLDRVTFVFIPETSALIRAFKERAVDVVNPPPAPETIADLRTLAAEGADVQVRSGPIWEHINFQFGPNNRNADSLNQYVEFRQAVAHGLDKRALVEAAVAPGVEPQDSFFEAFTPGLSGGAWAQYDHDPAKARALIAGLCARLGRDCEADPPRLVFSTTSNGDVRVRIAQTLVPMLEESGIVVEGQLEDSSVFFGETLDYGTWDVGEWAWVGNPGLASLISILEIFDPAAPPPDGQNFYRWGTPAVTDAEDELFNQGPSTVRDEHTERFAEILAGLRSTVDEEEIVELLAQAERLLADQAVIIPLYSRLDPGVAWADEVGNYVHNPSSASDLWNVELWYRRDR